MTPRIILLLFYNTKRTILRLAWKYDVFSFRTYGRYINDFKSRLLNTIHKNNARTFFKSLYLELMDEFS